jgi:hypothetical protein
MNIVDLRNNEKNVKFRPDQEEGAALLLSLESLGFKRNGMKFTGGHQAAGILVIESTDPFTFRCLVTNLAKKAWTEPMTKDQRLQYMKIGYVLRSCYMAWSHAKDIKQDV